MPSLQPPYPPTSSSSHCVDSRKGVANYGIPLTGAGVELLVPVPFPGESPQQSTLPVVSSAHVSPNPAVIAMALLIPTTVTGVDFEVLAPLPNSAPFPNSPTLLSPQQSMLRLQAAHRYDRYQRQLQSRY